MAFNFAGEQTTALPQLGGPDLNRTPRTLRSSKGEGAKERDSDSPSSPQHQIGRVEARSTTSVFKTTLRAA